MPSAERTFTIEVPIPIPVFQLLCEYMDHKGERRDLGEVAGRAIREWLQSANHAPLEAAAMLTGYQWKNLFLPSGTVLRTVFKGRHYQAIVQDDVVIFEGRSVSPSEFVNSIGGARRNAWKAVWLLFPSEKIWKMACACRDTRKRV
ncbi:MAG TPA: hypothetical protein VF861_05535 [Telluria sp.]